MSENLYVHVHSERNVSMLDSKDQPVELSTDWAKAVQQYAVGTVIKTEMLVWEVEIRIPVRHNLGGISAQDMAEAAMLNEDEAGFNYASVMIDPDPLIMTMRVYAQDVPGAVHNATSMLEWEQRKQAKVMAVNPAPAKGGKR